MRIGSHFRSVRTEPAPVKRTHRLAAIRSTKSRGPAIARNGAMQLPTNRIAAEFIFWQSIAVTASLNHDARMLYQPLLFNHAEMNQTK